jgi:hypothetical protein
LLVPLVDLLGRPQSARRLFQQVPRTTKDVGEVVRDYRNYIHPQKEHSHGVSISADDARTLWEIAKSVARQVLKP